MTDSPSGVGARAPIEPLIELLERWKRKGQSELAYAVDNGNHPSALVAAMRLHCANELEALLRSSGPAQTEAGALLRGLADVADGRVRSLDDIDAELSGPAQKDAPEPEKE